MIILWGEFWSGSESLTLLCVRRTGRATVAWWRSCRPSVRMRRATRSRALCPGLPARHCIWAGASAPRCVPPSWLRGPSGPPLSTYGPPPCRYQWLASAALHLSSAPGNTHTPKHTNAYAYTHTPTHTRSLSLQVHTVITKRVMTQPQSHRKKLHWTVLQSVSGCHGNR